MNRRNYIVFYTKSPYRATLAERLNHAVIAGKGRDITHPDGIQEIGVQCACGMEFVGKDHDDIEAIELALDQWYIHRKSMLACPTP